jgi:predicted nucleic acid-binding protein
MKPTITSKFALDTNILIYSHDNNDGVKQNIARDLIIRLPIVSTQVISEYINVLKRILKVPKEQLFQIFMPNLNYCDIATVDIDTLHKAEHIMLKYNLQIFDSIIIASAIESNCKVLYSEDLQHNQIIEGILMIQNPFVYN